MRPLKIQKPQWQHEQHEQPDADSMQVGGDHYIEMAIEPWAVIGSWPIDQQIGFHRGNALKYLMRMGSKDSPVQEIRKAAHYLSKLVEVLEGSELEAM